MVKRLMFLNGLATVLAVVHHSSIWVQTSVTWWVDRYSALSVPDFGWIGGVGFYVFRSIDQIAFVGVFAFLFVSGYFAGVAVEGGHLGTGWKVALARVRTLIPPYLVWSFVALFGMLLQGQAISLGELAYGLALGGIAAPYFYVPLLLQLYLLSPLLLPLARDHWRTLLAGAVACQLISIGLLYGRLLGANLGGVEPFARALHNWHLPAYATWFILGMVAASHRAAFRALLDRYRRLLLWSAGGLFFAGIAEWEILRRASGRTWISPQDTLLDNLYAFLFLLFVLAFDQVGLKWGPFFNRVSARSYGIYLSHIPILEFAARGTYHLAPLLLALPALFQLSLIVCGLGLPLLAMAVVRRSFPGKYYRWAFG